MDTEQVRALLFHTPKHGRRIAQRRLAALAKRGQIHRERGPEGIYVYAMDRPPAQMEHRLLTAWAYVWIRAGLAPEERLIAWRSIDLGGLRPDAMAEIYRPKGNRMMFVEADNHQAGGPFTKVCQYSDYHRAGKFGDWAKRTRSFPPILVVTTSWARHDEIARRIATENDAGLQWILKHVDTMKEEC